MFPFHYIASVLGSSHPARNYITQTHILVLGICRAKTVSTQCDLMLTVTMEIRCKN